MLERILSRFGYEKADSRPKSGAIRSFSRNGSGRLLSDSNILRNWNALSQYGNVNRKVVIERSRDYVANDGFLRNACSVFAHNAIGTGIRPNPSVPDNDEYNKRVRQLWDDDFIGNADSFGGLSYYAMQAAAFKSMFASGECFIVRRRVDDGKPFSTRLQIMQTEQLDESVNDEDTDHGIEYDHNGKPTAYWLYPRILTGSNYYLNNNFQSSRIPAEDVIHLYDNENGTQTRGMPWPSAVLKTLFQIQSVQTSEAQRRMMEACFVAIVNTDATNNIEDLIPERQSSGGSLLTDSDGEDIRDLRPGMIGYMPQGASMTFNDPKSSGDFPSWMRAYQMFAAAGLGIPYVLVTGDFAAINFASYKGAQLEFRKNIKSIQENILYPKLCGRVYEWFLEEAELRGYVDFADPKVNWTPPHIEYLDPQKENQAAIMAIENGLTTLEAEQTARGFNPNDIMESIKRERDAYSDAEIKIPAFGSNGGGMNPQAAMMQMMAGNAPQQQQEDEPQAEEAEDESQDQGNEDAQEQEEEGN